MEVKRRPRNACLFALFWVLRCQCFVVLGRCLVYLCACRWIAPVGRACKCCLAHTVCRPVFCCAALWDRNCGPSCRCCRCDRGCTCRLCGRQRRCCTRYPRHPLFCPDRECCHECRSGDYPIEFDIEGNILDPQPSRDCCCWLPKHYVDGKTRALQASGGNDYGSDGYVV